MIAVLRSYSHCVTETESDRLGRWSKVTLNGAKDKRLTVYSVYNVVENNVARAGLSTVYRQQWQLLRLAGKINPNPRKQMIIDLDQSIAKSR